MQAAGRELGEFERLIAEDRDLATQVLFASVGALTNLQTSRAVRGELSRADMNGCSLVCFCLRVATGRWHNRADFVTLCDTRRVVGGLYPETTHGRSRPCLLFHHGDELVRQDDQEFL